MIINIFHLQTFCSVLSLILADLSVKWCYISLHNHVGYHKIATNLTKKCSLSFIRSSVISLLVGHHFTISCTLYSLKSTRLILLLLDNLDTEANREVYFKWLFTVPPPPHSHPPKVSFILGYQISSFPIYLATQLFPAYCYLLKHKSITWQNFSVVS